MQVCIELPNTVFVRYSCWLSLERGVIWAFVGPALLVIVVSLGLISKLLFFRNTMSNKCTTEKLTKHTIHLYRPNLFYFS